jgi:hypothetical protein
MKNNQELIQVLRDLVDVTKNYKVGINKDRLYRVEHKTFKRAEHILNNLHLQNVSDSLLEYADGANAGQNIRGINGDGESYNLTVKSVKEIRIK